MEIPRQVSPSKESAVKNGVGGESTNNYKILRKTYKEMQNFLEIGEGGDLVNGQKKKRKKKTARKDQKCYVILRNYGTVEEKWGNYKNQNLFCKYLTSYKRSKIYKEGIAMNNSKEILINMICGGSS